jgi:hypothetical protein
MLQPPSHRPILIETHIAHLPVSTAHEKDGLGNANQQSDQRIPPPQMTQFVGDNPAEV